MQLWGVFIAKFLLNSFICCTEVHFQTRDLMLLHSSREISTQPNCGYYGSQVCICVTGRIHEVGVMRNVTEKADWAALFDAAYGSNLS